MCKINTANYKNCITENGISISVNLEAEEEFKGSKYLPMLAPKLDFWQVWHNNIDKISEEENTRYYVTEYFKQTLSKLDPQEIFDLIPDESILLCNDTDFPHRHLVSFWFELFLGVRTSEIKENPVRETLTLLTRPEYLKDVMEEAIKENYDMHCFDTIKEAYEFNKRYNIKEIEEKRRYKEELIEKGLYGIVMAGYTKEKKNVQTLELKLTS